MIRLFACLFFSTTPATAQVMRCAGYVETAAALAAQYGEAPIGSGATASGADAPRQELWVNPATGTWSLLAVTGDLACLRAAGDAWRFGGMGAPA